MHISIPSRVRQTMSVLQEAGGQPLLVGGFVRDRVRQELCLGDQESKDVDIEVRLPPQRLIEILPALGGINVVGESFGVIKLTFEDGEQYDISIPRRESKDRVVGGHRGFNILADPDLSLEEAAARRDFTINSMAADIDGLVHDPFHGIADLVAGRLRATSERFVDDPLRVLRAMQFASRFGMFLDTTTADMCRNLLPEFRTLSQERILEEWLKWSRGSHPILGLNVLVETGWLSKFPMLQALVGVEQDPEWHPEGDVWTHTALATQEAAEIAWREELDRTNTETLVLSALLHDIGKPATSSRREDGRIISHGHDVIGSKLAMEFLRTMRAPQALVSSVGMLVKEHMTHAGAVPTPNVVRRLANRMAPFSTVRMLSLLSEADASGRSPLPPSSPMTEWERIAEPLNIQEAGPTPILQGRHLIKLGMKPGPAFGPILREAFEAQLDGQIEDLAGAEQWVLLRGSRIANG